MFTFVLEKTRLMIFTIISLVNIPLYATTLTFNHGDGGGFNDPVYTYSLCNEWVTLDDFRLTESGVIDWTINSSSIYYVVLRAPEGYEFNIDNVTTSDENSSIYDGTETNKSNTLAVNENEFYFEFDIEDEDVFKISSVTIEGLQIRIIPGESPEGGNIVRAEPDKISPNSGSTAAVMPGNAVGDDLSYGSLEPHVNYEPAFIFSEVEGNICENETFSIYGYPESMFVASTTYNPVSSTSGSIISGTETGFLRENNSNIITPSAGVVELDGNKLTFKNINSTNGGVFHSYWFPMKMGMIIPEVSDEGECYVESQPTADVSRVLIDETTLTSNIESVTTNATQKDLRDENEQPEYNHDGGNGYFIGDGIIDQYYFTPTVFTGIEEAQTANIRYVYTNSDGCTDTSSEVSITVNPEVSFLTRLDADGDVSDFSISEPYCVENSADLQNIKLNITSSSGDYRIDSVVFFPEEVVTSSSMSIEASVGILTFDSGTFKFDYSSISEWASSLDIVITADFSQAIENGGVQILLYESTTDEGGNTPQENQEEAVLSIFTPDNLTIIGLDTLFCPNDDLVEYVGFPSGGSYSASFYDGVDETTLLTLGSYTLSQETFLPSELEESNSPSSDRFYQLTYEVAGSSCPNGNLEISQEFRILAGPEQEIQIVNEYGELGPYCFGEDIKIEDLNKVVVVDTNADGAKKYSLLIDGVSIFTNQYSYASTDFNHYSLDIEDATTHTIQLFVSELNDTNNCPFLYTEDIYFAGNPQADFDYLKVCEGQETTFLDSSSFESGTNNEMSNTYFWDLGDGTTSDLPQLNHEYASPGIYEVQFARLSDSMCADTIIKKVHIKERYVINETETYYESFNTDDSVWVSSYELELGENGSFVWGNPTNFDNTDTNHVWYTNNGNNGYNAEEISWVESPCYNFEGVVKPMINLKLLYDAEFGADGMVLQYTYSDTTDGNEDWFTLGGLEEGIEGYNSNAVTSIPKNTSMNVNNVREAWTGDTDEEWVIAKYILDSIQTEMSDNGYENVRFRTLFTSNKNNINNQVFPGVAFDSVIITARNRVSLIEHFTNATNDIDTVYNNNLTKIIDAYSQSLVDIRYHIKKPVLDPIVEYVPYESSARSLYYGIEAPSRTVLDGYFYKDGLLEGTSNELTVENSSRLLSSTPFNLAINTIGETNGIVNVSIDISLINDYEFNAPVKAFVAVLADDIEIEDKDYENVLLALLPNGAGMDVDTMSTGETQSLDFEWTRTDQFNNPNYKFVAFIQNQWTKEVLQATLAEEVSEGSLPNTSVQPVKENGGELFSVTNNASLKLWPNPVEHILKISGVASNQISSLIVTDMLGKSINVQPIVSDDIVAINVENLANGIYFIQLEGSQKIRFIKQ